MKRVITKSEGVRTALRILLLVMIVMIWPLRLFHEDIGEQNTASAVEDIVISGEDNNAAQSFVTDYAHLQYIELRLTPDQPAGKFHFMLFDAENKLICEQDVDTSENERNGNCRICINRDLEPDTAYVYLIKAVDDGSSVSLQLEDTAVQGNVSQGVMTYQNSSMENRSLIASYIYREPLRKGRSALIILALLVIMVVSDMIISKLSKKYDIGNSLVPDTWTYQILCNPLIILFAVWGMIAAGPMHIFGKHIFDIVILEAGIVMLAATLLYVVNRPYPTKERKMALADSNEGISDCLQVIFIALAIWATINYQNGIADVFHDIAFRQMLIFMGLALIVTFRSHELWNVKNLIGVIASTVFSVIFVHKQIPAQVDSYHVTSLRLLGVLIVVCTILAINTVCVIANYVRSRFKPENAVRKNGGKNANNITESHRISAYGILTAVMMLAFIWRRNTRWWPVIMVVAFAVYFIRYSAWERRSALLVNVARGMSLNFIACTAYCLMHRPFLSFLLTRYPHMFFTVTETATYLAAAIAASMVLLFDRYNKNGKWRSCVGELLLFGTEMVYAMFTMSRTVILAVAVSFFVMLFALAGRGMKKKASGRLSLLMSCVLVTLWCFPICFSMQRMIPAVVAEPVIYDYEKDDVPDEIVRGDIKDSMYYMTFERFANYFCYKMLGTPEHTFDLNIYDIAKTDIHMQEKSLTASNTSMQADSKISFADGSLTARNDTQPESVPESQIVSESTSEATAEALENEETEVQSEEITNGRTSIFRSYIFQMNLLGHDTMGATLEDGSTASHAHNIYLQVSYDNGIIVGGLFVVWIIATIGQSIVYLRRRYKTDRAAGLPLSVVVTFAAAGMVEWVSHPCIPLGLMFLLVLPPLIYAPDEKEHSCDITAAGR